MESNPYETPQTPDPGKQPRGGMSTGMIVLLVLLAIPSTLIALVALCLVIA
jgi:hypothetical protein